MDAYEKTKLTVTDEDFNDLLLILDELEKPEAITEHTVVVDWLTVSFFMEMPEIQSIKSVCLQKGKYVINHDSYLLHLESSLNDFESSAMLFIDNRLIGRLLFNPRSELDRRTVHLIFDNQLFYENKHIWYLAYIVHGLNFMLDHIVRLDIANDYILKAIFLFWKRFQRSDKIRKKGKATINPKQKGNKEYKSIILGSVNSGKRISIYNKSKELLKNPKPYVQEYWAQYKLDYVNNDVERVELRLLTEELKNIDVWRLYDPDYLLAICRFHFKNYFEFEGQYREHGKTVIKDVTPIDIEFKDCKTVYNLTRSKSVPTANYLSTKIQLHSLYLDAKREELIQANEKDLHNINPMHLDSCKMVIDRKLERFPELIPYYTRKIKTWDNEFRTKYIGYSHEADKMLDKSINDSKDFDDNGLIEYDENDLRAYILQNKIDSFKRIT